MTSEHRRDPWVDVRTRHDFPADEVISALQREIRRGNTESGALLAYEMVTTSPEMEAYLWRRLLAISVEDVGLGSASCLPSTPCATCVPARKIAPATK